MGTGLIPADGEVWRTRRRAIVPALHRRYVESMVRESGAGKVMYHTAALFVEVCRSATQSTLASALAPALVEIVPALHTRYDESMVSVAFSTLRVDEHRSSVR